MRAGNSDGLRVLCVDDDASFVELTSTYLERINDEITTVTTTSPQDVVSILAESQIDCIVSDYEMPGLDGLELLEHIRADNPNIPFILFTGKGSETIASEAISAGVTDYLQKQSGSQQYELLVQRIQNAVAKYRASERAHEQSKRILDASPDMITITVDGEVRYVNDAGVELLGAKSRDEILGRHLAEFIPEENRELLRENIEAIQQSSAEVYLQSRRLKTVRGTEVPIEVSGRPIEWEESPGVVSVIRDVSSRERRQQELERTQSRFTQLVDHLDEITVWQSDSKLTRVDYLSAGFESMFGISRKRAYDDITAFLEVVHKDDREEVRDAMQRISSAAERHADSIPGLPDFRVVHPNGETRWIENRIIPIREENEIVELVGITVDITDRKEREQELQRTQQQLQTILDTAPADVFMTDLDGEVLLINEHAQDMFGVEDDPAGKHFEEVLPDDQSLIETQREYLTRVANGETVKTETEIPTPTDSYHVLTVQAPVRDDNGEPYAMCGISIDITEQMEKAAQLERQNDHLETVINILSHDLLNPLNVASGNLELAREECDSDALDVTENALNRIETIIERTLTLTREGRSVGTVEHVSLTELAEQCWDTVETEDATLTVESNLHVDADPDRLRHILENLYRNAVEHAGPKVRVRVGGLAEGFYVEDDGPGIPESEREEALETGYTTAEEGTGIGLAIVNELARAHEWDLRVTDSSEGGTRFEFISR